MQFGVNKLSSSVRLALSLGAVIAMGAAMPAFAQDSSQSTAPASKKEATTLQTVTVTGSRIRSVDVETQQPVFTMTQQDIQKTGLTTVGDIIQHMTSMGTPAFNKSTILASNFEQGGSYADMRNLGAQRVLVLVNGKRWVTGINGFTDLSNIPSALIQRVEVLKDGASSVYGSDAITGVVNFILNDRFDGAQASAYYGSNEKGDGQTTQYDFTVGTHTDKSSIIFSTSYNKQDTVWASKRSLTAHAYGPAHANDALGVGPWGWIVSPTGDLLAHNHTGTDSLGLGQGADSRDPANYHPYAGDPTDRFNYNSQEMQRIPTELNSIFTHGSYDITDNISVKATAMYADRRSTTQIAGYPLNSNSQPNYPVYIDANNYYNPYPGNDLTFYRRTIELPRISRNDFKSYHLDADIEGYFDVGEHEWNWDVGFNYNRGDGLVNGSGNLNLVALKNALGPSFLNAGGVVQCGTATNPMPLGTSLSAGQCTPIDLIGGPSASTAQGLAYINALTKEAYSSTVRSYTANITGGLFNLPAGEFGFAAGVESRSTSGYDHPDLASQSGFTTDLAANSTSGHYRVNEGYVEFNAPLLRDLPGAKSLSVDVASRYSHYSNFGSTTNNKYGFKWKPIDDLLVRGNYAEGFRAPTVGDLFGGGSQSFDTYLDPCDSVYGSAASNSSVAALCSSQGLSSTFRQLDQGGKPITSPGGTQSTTPFNAGAGNGALQPETARTRTLGLVYSPSYVHGLDVTLDWYGIRISNLITGISANYVLNQCYISNAANYCAAFSRDPGTGQIVTLNRGNANLGYLKTEGYDLGVNYRLPMTDYGQFTTHLEAAYVSKYESQSAPGAVVSQSVGQYPVYRVRANFTLDWTMGDWGATWTTRYYSALRDYCYSSTECNQPNYNSPSWDGGVGAQRRGATAFNDIQVRWQAPWNAQIAAGVNNVFAKKPSLLYYANFNGYNNASSIDPNLDLDRYFYVRYTQKF